MRITPLDIRKQEFRKAMRGLDTEEVHAFLTTVADEYEAVLNDNKALKERLLELDDKVQEYRNMEKTLRNTLLTAERVNAEAKENARREAGLIIKEAEIEAEKTLRNIRNDQSALRNAVQELKRQKESYISRIRMVAEAHLKFIESAERDMEDDDIAVDSIPVIAAPKSVAAPAPVPATPPDPVRARGEAVPEEEAALSLSVEPELPGVDTEEEASLFPRVNEAAAPMTEEIESESMPDLNEILERLGANRTESMRPAAPAPAAPAAPVPGQMHAPAAPAAPLQAAAEEVPAAHSNSADGEWSLERLKRDILSGSSSQNEKT